MLADNTAASLDLILHEHDTVLNRFAGQPPIRALDARRCDPLIDGYAKVHSEFNAVGLVDPGLGQRAALEEIEKNSGKTYDARVVEACLRLFREKGYVLES
ncbi:MAG: hypothetical protein HYU75_11135 [Betaproteobacteria bacterium]|nr:hypothetical protein [Betaproteobacteria bacterium]